MDKKIAFIGCGNMGTALVSRLCKNKEVDLKNIIVSRRSLKNLKAIEDLYHVDTTASNTFACEIADIVVLCVKPNVLREVVDEIKDSIHKEATIISIAAGISLSTLRKWLPDHQHIIRAMPNTPSQVQEGMIAICIGDASETDIKIQECIHLFSCCGKCEIINEENMAAFIGVSGSSPAYVYIMIEAMADAGVKQGLPRDQAIRFASQAILGSAKMVLETQEHPASLKDKVCSPRGTTIEAVATLEKNGFRNAIIEAVSSAANKNRDME